MGRINAIIPDELERELRKKAAEKFVGKKGSLGFAVAEAVELWLKQQARLERSK
jgi:hypothetical protein